MAGPVTAGRSRFEIRQAIEYCASYDGAGRGHACERLESCRKGHGEDRRWV